MLTAPNWGGDRMESGISAKMRVRQFLFGYEGPYKFDELSAQTPHPCVRPSPSGLSEGVMQALLNLSYH